MRTKQHTTCTDLVSKSHKVQDCIFRINRLGKQQASLFLFLVLTLIPCDVFVAFKITYMGQSIAAIRGAHTVVDNWALVDVGELRSSSPNKKVALYMGEVLRKRREVTRFIKYSKMFETATKDRTICSHYSHVPLICRSDWIF